MKENNFSPLMKVHLALMAVLVLMNLITTCVQIFQVLPAVPPQGKSFIIVMILGHLVNIAALVAGINYLMKRYQKSAAKLYKTMIILAAVSSILHMSNAFGLLQVENMPELEQVGSTANFIIAVSLMAVKTVLLLCLALWQDLGKRRTWILFTIILIADLAYGLLFSSAASTPFNRLTNALSRLLMDGTIGLAIKGKYDDKDARGTV